MTGNRPEVLGTTASSMMMERIFPQGTDKCESLQLMDHTLPSESFSQDLSYIPSPDSLFMYEHERNLDTLSNSCNTSLGTPVMPSCMASLERGDLKYQLEQSEMYPGTDNDLRQMYWDVKDMDFVKMEDVFQDSSDANEGPTLAQLNSFIGDSQIVKSNLSKATHSNQSVVPVTYSEQWNTGILDDWTSSPDTSQCSPAPSNSQQGFATMSNSKKWNNSTFSRGTVVSRAADEAYVSPTQCGNTAPIQGLMIKQEPSFDAKCLVQSRFQNPSISQSDQTGTSLQRLLLQGRYRGNHTSGSPTPPVSPTKHMVTPTATVCTAEPIGNSDNTMDQLWEEVKHYIHDDENNMDISTVKIKRERLDSNSSVITSMEELETRDDESMDSDNGEEEYLSDQDSSDSDGSEHTSPRALKTKEKQYFWQYNVQSKGPKGKKLCLTMDTVDPHVLPNFEDPVFDPDYKVPGISHGGKARRGDGNNVYPNPKKLCQIGNELKKLNRRIGEYGPLNDMPSAVRNKSRKEKNKLASRACRLKKKAQHEANKVKLMGLEQEHSQLMTVISLIKSDTLKRLSKVSVDEESLTRKLEAYISTHIKGRIAGSTTEFVNEVIQKVNSGDSKGGLDL